MVLSIESFGTARLNRKGMICPKCNENSAHRSHRTVLDWTISWLALKPYRCKSCAHRFYVYKSGVLSSKLRTPEERKIIQLRRSIKWRRTRVELLLYGISLLIFLAILVYLVQQRIEPPGE